MSCKARLIAFYLPQFHPITENDGWWGKGFTEWTNVTKAKPLFKGHTQPKHPADLGYYDLRIPEVREQQAVLAREHGITAFSYWHYWFGNGKRVLERPFNEMITSGKPDFPFCLSWANQTWTGHWHGANKRILIEQTYGGRKDYEDHFNALLPAFQDRRYLKVDNKPIFLVYNPWDIPNPKEFTNSWQELAIKNNLEGIFFIAIDNTHENINKYGMNGSTWHEPTSHSIIQETLNIRIKRKLGFLENPKRIYYKDFVDQTLNNEIPMNRFPMLVPNWDNTPRSQKKGLVFLNSTPGLFKNHLSKGLRLVENKDRDKQIVFIKSWNEWAEGNYLEPDSEYGLEYLRVIKKAMN